jgi:hypothetical protein
MSDYSEDFEEGGQHHSKNSLCLKSQESQQETLKRNLDALKEEIKVLEIEQLKNLESFGSVDTIELADDSSQDDLTFIKSRQEDLKTRAGTREVNSKAQAKVKIQSRLLPKREPLKINSSESRNSQRRQISSMKKELKSNENSFYYSRPKQIISAVPNIRTFKKFSRKLEGKTFRNVIPFDSFERNSRETGPDWKKSILESYVNSETFEFNWEKDESLLTEEQILHNKKSGSLKVLSRTFKRLSREMFYDNKFNSATVKVELQRLLMARKTLINALKVIHEREDLLITLLTLGKEAGSELDSMIQQFRILNKNVLVLIQRLKDSILGIKNFVYFGEDYERKIQEDDKKLKKIGLC